MIDEISIEELHRKTQDLLCAPHLELVCQCAGMGSCGACKIMRLARQWIRIYGEKPCQHLQTMKVGWTNNLKDQCLECGEIVK